VGIAGIKVNPYDTGEIAAAIASVLLDDDIAQWYHNAGINRAAKFTWSDCAERTMQVYEEVSRSRN
jgi:glycosyltransferase involved in cell wall biosynthesis